MSLTEQERQSAERAICAHTLSLMRTLVANVPSYSEETKCARSATEAPVVAMYAATQSEVDVSSCFSPLRAHHYTIAFPRVLSSGQMDMRLVQDERDLSVGTFGILEPSEHAEIISPLSLSVILVPGLAFSREGGRLGYGGGYYDRFLSSISPDAICVGICFHRQFLADLPIESHDHKMDYIVTEQGVVKCRTS